jgi:hypothetical protein
MAKGQARRLQRAPPIILSLSKDELATALGVSPVELVRED